MSYRLYGEEGVFYLVHEVEELEGGKCDEYKDNSGNDCSYGF